MALRSLDNTLPITADRPKKATKIIAATGDPAVNDENMPAPPFPAASKAAAEQSVDYIATKDLKPLADPEGKIKDLLDELGSTDWTRVCRALNDTRQLAVHHSILLLPILEKTMLNIVKAMKSPRSALCKTSIMACGDIFRYCGQHLLISDAEDTTAFDGLLLQLLLKASQDKRFMCEEAGKALEIMACNMSPLPLLKKLQCYVNHANLRVRAKAAVTIANCISKMVNETMKEFGLAALIQMASELLNDRLPEAREAARSIVVSVYCVFSDGIEPNEDRKSKEAAEEENEDPWQSFCASNLTPLACQSIAKIVSQ